MFLALLDSDKQDDLNEIAAMLLRVARKNLPGNERVKEARGLWKKGLRDEDKPDRELADRSYLVMCYVSEAFNSLQGLIGGGDGLVCAAIRKVSPLAPQGFCKVGRWTPMAQSPSSRVEPYRSYNDG